MGDKHLIDHPDGLEPGRQVADKVISAVSTGALLYFLVLITLGIWYFAGGYFAESVFSWRHLEASVTILLQLAGVALGSLLLLLAWSEYNFRMYANRTRRRATPPVKQAEVAEFFGVAAADVSLAQTAKSMVFRTAEGMYSICELDGRCVKLRRVETDPADES
jgi:poly-beta-1,6-N-acetyl-D-glucosamine biosynthesis protein PgaD